MEKRRLGRTGLMVTPLGLGTSEIGYQLETGTDVSALLNEFLDDGLNLIDTAECYVDAEEKIGKAVGHRRNEFVLLTKTGHAYELDGEDWDPAVMEIGLERSLRNLQTDHVDVLQIHSCSLATLEKGDVIEVLKKAKEQGKTKFLGFSGDGEAAKWAVESGIFDTLQTSLNIADQEALDLTLPTAAQKDMGVILKRPVANGAWLGVDAPRSNYQSVYWQRLKELDYPFLRKPDDPMWPVNPFETALRFSIFTPGVSTAIVGTKSSGRWRENAEIIAKGPLGPAPYLEIRAKWKAVAKPDWVGQT